MFSKPKHFGLSTSKESIQNVKNSAVPLNTQKNTAWATIVWTNGLNNCKCQAEPILLKEEECLWSRGQLETHNPHCQAPLDTPFFVGICFGLRGSQEHRQLRWSADELFSFLMVELFRIASCILLENALVSHLMNYYIINEVYQSYKHPTISKKTPMHHSTRFAYTLYTNMCTLIMIIIITPH